MLTNFFLSQDNSTLTNITKWSEKFVFVQNPIQLEEVLRIKKYGSFKNVGHLKVRVISKLCVHFPSKFRYEKVDMGFPQ